MAAVVRKPFTVYRRSGAVTRKTSPWPLVNGLFWGVVGALFVVSSFQAASLRCGAESCLNVSNALTTICVAVMAIVNIAGSVAFARRVTRWAPGFSTTTCTLLVAYVVYRLAVAPADSSPGTGLWTAALAAALLATWSGYTLMRGQSGLFEAQSRAA